MEWGADRTPGFSSVRIQQEILRPREISYSIKYGSGDISVELMNTPDLSVAVDVMAEMESQGIKAAIKETDRGFIIQMVA